MMTKTQLTLTVCGFALLTNFFSPSFAHAETPATTEAATPAPADAGDEFNSDAMLTGDWGGVRKALFDRGLNLNATEIAEFMGNPSGGTNQGTIFEGRLEVSAALDLDKMFGWNGWSLFANAYQLHGRGMSASDVGNIMTMSSIEANRTTRLFDFWVQKDFADGEYSVRFGQLAADDEFITSENSALYMNSVFGWPSSLATDLTSGGPAFPLTTPGVRFRVGTAEKLSFTTAVFDGDPGGHGDGSNPQLRNSSGTAFNLDRGALFMNELAYGLNRGKDDTGLPATYKLGFWYHTENFADPHDDDAGDSLASSSSSGTAKMHHGNYGIYGVIDQTVWVNPSCKDESISLFTRVMLNAPDRNVAAYQVDAGVNMKGINPHRPEDTLGLAFSHIGISDSAINYDKDLNTVNGTNNPVRDSETLIEATYQAPITP